MKKLKITAKIFELSFRELDPDERRLILNARKKIDTARPGNSEFAVGTAVLTSSGHTFCGTTQEIYCSVVCAELVTIHTALNAGHQHGIVKIAVTGKPVFLLNYVGQTPFVPCGACLQAMKGLEDLAGKELIIIMDCFNNSKIWRAVGVKSLLPLAINPEDLRFTFASNKI